MYPSRASCAPRLQPYVSQVRELRLAAERSFRLHLATHLLSLSPAEGGIQGGTRRTEEGIQRAVAPEASSSRGQRQSPDDGGGERGTPASAAAPHCR
jgi:hypothetical protein